MSKDTIYREDAIALIKPMVGAFTDNGFVVDYESVLSILENIPSADRPQGGWIEEGCANGSEMCNQCGFVQLKGRTHNFCPNCGADMRSKIVGKHADFMMIDEACAKGADDD